MKYWINLKKLVTLALERDTAKKLYNKSTFINTSFRCNTPVSPFTFTCMVLTGFLD